MAELPGSLLAGRWRAVWWRNLRVWAKLWGPAMLGNFGEPLLYLIALGYGLGFFVGTVDGLPYLVFLASGIVCSSAMQTASFEAMYSAYTRLAVQHTWEGMLATPLETADIVWGEVLWAATKGLLSVGAILLVAALLGTVADWRALWVLPVVGLAGVCFAALALIMTALARSYDFFLYYWTLLVTPMLLLSGVFFPLDNLPEAVRAGVHCLPLAHAVELVRPLMTGRTVPAPGLHLSIILAYAVAGLSVATFLLKRRLHQ